MKNYRELEVWQVSRRFVVEVYRLLKKFPSEEKFALCDQIRRAAISVPSNIAEGFGRDTHKDFAHFLVQAQGSLCEVETQLILAADLGYISGADIPSSTLTFIAKMLSSFITHLRTTPAPSTQHQAPSTNYDGYNLKDRIFFDADRRVEWREKIAKEVAVGIWLASLSSV